jgi:hypothetical protein
MEHADWIQGFDAAQARFLMVTAITHHRFSSPVRESARSQNLLTTARNITGPAGDLRGDIGRAVLANLHGPRRPRVCARKVKSPLSRWNKHPDGKPRTTCRITGITAHIDASHHQPATRRRKSVTAAEGP